MDHNISKRELFEVWSQNKNEDRFDSLYTFVLRSYGDEAVQLNDDTSSQIKTVLRSLIQQLNLKWEKCERKRSRFLIKNLEWLQGFYTFPNIPVGLVPDQPLNRGRPSKSFSECCEQTKRRKAKETFRDNTIEEIAIAAEIKLYDEGKRDTASLVKELCIASPQRGTNIKKARSRTDDNSSRIGPDEALALIIDTNLSTSQYNTIRETSNAVVKNMYPAYCKVKEAKSRCYPLDISITETTAKVPLQSLLDHTIKRLCLVQEEVFSIVPDVTNIHFLIKWGCDGAQQSRYKQRFSTADATDESIFSFSLVPIQLYGQIENLKKIIWQNPAPSSTRYCRPIQLLFAKETPELIESECKKMDDDIQQLIPIRVELNGKEFQVTPVLIFSMIDGKVCSSLSNYSSSQTCYICGATPKFMNRPCQLEKNSIDDKTLRFGLSPLHSWIRFMECILHIAYRIPLKVWRVEGAENKAIMKEEKKRIQERFKSELGLLVDMPNQQSGNTNDGNTSRRFFRNTEKTADITGVDVELIDHFHIILETLNCGFPIDAEAFEQYAKETFDIYLKHYAWYYMPCSVHKVLFHGAEVIKTCILPIGQMSEEAQEARNKDTRNYREAFTRKISRVATNTDLFNRLFISSDPFIAARRHMPKRGNKKHALNQEVLKLLQVPKEDGAQSSDSAEE